ncbi:hypothetical protein BVC71_03595 [Marivivens niveibacter]|uniref:Flagellar motor switch protein FliN-like C-terminal domain-containing protein n=1 Tax=Marivivens niveibacter TaxID=1930667 RepID=A0A251X2I0_9RHOB|nr:FliM/FliN family flagellar motor C-terminal domain-containing protein [Marivivens niveibacter]OUD10588.1 hypothetical protein BVC71_03595 [Marivivens niveibacter]
MHESDPSILSQMLRNPIPPEPAPGPDRLLRVAFERAADGCGPLTDQAVGIALTKVALDDLHCLVDETCLIASIDRGGKTVGAVMLCAELRNALVELQTCGAVQPRVSPLRASTPVDWALVAPFVTQALAELEAEASDVSALQGAKGAKTGAIIRAARSLTMLLADADYDVITATFDLGHDRIGRVMLAFPPAIKPKPEKPETPPAKVTLSTAVLDAPTCLDAVLHRMKLPISEVEEFDVGQLVMLNGAAINHVELLGPDRSCVGIARLGQMSGQRAVRLDAKTPPEMTDGGIPVSKSVKTPILAASDCGDLGG